MPCMCVCVCVCNIKEVCICILPFPVPGDLPDPGIEPTFPVSPALPGRFFTTDPPGKPYIYIYIYIYKLPYIYMMV